MDFPALSESNQKIMHLSIPLMTGPLTGPLASNRIKLPTTVFFSDFIYHSMHYNYFAGEKQREVSAKEARDSTNYRDEWCYSSTADEMKGKYSSFIILGNNLYLRKIFYMYLNKRLNSPTRVSKVDEAVRKSYDSRLRRNERFVESKRNVYREIKV